MSKKTPVVAAQHKTSRSSFRAYVIGFVLSITLTLAAYILAMAHINSGHEKIGHGVLLIGILGMAVLQLFVQLQFFIHLGHESKPRWNKIVFVFMVTVVLIIVFGSIWIMENLHYNMSSTDVENYIIQEEGIKP